MKKKEDQLQNTNDSEKMEVDSEIKKLDISDSDLINLISDEKILYIIQKLREGPLETDGLAKILKVKFRSMPKVPKEYMDLLMKFQFVREYSFKKVHPPPDKFPDQYPKLPVGAIRKYYILLKDFYAIRTPPVDILELLNDSELPNKEIREFRKDIETFFKKYTGFRNAGDDPDIISLFSDQKSITVLGMLRKKFYRLTELKNEFQQIIGNDISDVLKVLESKDFIKIVANPEKNDSWIILKTNIELKPIFPEYLIRAINQQMAEKQLDKDFALITLNFLKKSYLELEQPEMLKKSLEKIALLEKNIEESIQANQNGKKLDKKSIIKNYKEIIELYRQIGDLDNLDKYEKIIREFEEKNK